MFSETSGSRNYTGLKPRRLYSLRASTVRTSEKKKTCLSVGTTGSALITFTPRPLYPRENSPQWSLDRRLGGAESQSGRHVVKQYLIPAGNRTPNSPAVQPVAHRRTGWDIADPGTRQIREKIQRPFRIIKPRFPGRPSPSLVTTLSYPNSHPKCAFIYKVPKTYLKKESIPRHTAINMIITGDISIQISLRNIESLFINSLPSISST
jgi:hypothetical protein